MIRPYKHDDWGDVCRVYDAAKPVELFTGGAVESFCFLDADASRKADLASSTVFVWEGNGMLRGFGGYRAAYIGWLFVDPPFFRHGIGRALLTHLLARIDGEPHLWTMECNSAAIALYASAGFRITERKRTQNRGFPCDAVRMTKPLSSRLPDRP